MTICATCGRAIDADERSVDIREEKLDPFLEAARTAQTAAVRALFQGSRTTAPDPVNHPPHYTAHPSGVECIQITEHMGFNLGNAMKYIWRTDLKNDAVEDLKKAVWYINREIAKREKP